MADLGSTPPANDFLRREQLTEPQPSYPLRALVCAQCFLVQLDTCIDPHRIFTDYAYFSSFSETLLRQAAAYTDAIVPRLGLGAGDRVVEIASNDGYLLRKLLARGLDVLGVEPAVNIAAAANREGIPTLNRFFTAALARQLVAQGGPRRLVIANNVMAHVPDLNDFVDGLRILLAPGGLATIDVHHVLRLLEEQQFDHIYHEHFQYFSLTSAQHVFSRHSLAIVDVEEISAEGGSIRIYVQHAADATSISARVGALLDRETAAGLRSLDTYAGFAEAVRRTQHAVRRFLIDMRAATGRGVVAYGAAAKGNTLLNACGVGSDLVEYVVDRNPTKQGLFLPGSRIPILPPEQVFATKPAYLLILPWNLQDEIVRQMAGIRAWGGQFVVPIPQPQIVT